MGTYSIEIQDIEKMRRTFQAAPERSARMYSAGLKIAANEIYRIMKEEVPVGKGLGATKKGNLKRSIVKNVQGLEAIIGPNLQQAPYAIFVHEGTRAHVITPRFKKALFWKGALHPVKKVNHPGTAANPFVQRTAKRAEPIVNDIFRRQTELLVEMLARNTA